MCEKPEFKPDTKLYKLHKILLDLEWHCGKCELPGTQPAKAIQILRQYGYSLEKKTQYCERCKEKTVYRRMVSLEVCRATTLRSKYTGKYRKQIIEYYKGVEAVSGRKMASNELEVDHKFPQVRWKANEKEINEISEDIIKTKYQLLTRQNNLLKSRSCEKCKDTGRRGVFINIIYFYAGGEEWDSNLSSDDEAGCVGCFWYDIIEWKRSINEFIESHNKE